MLSWLSNKWKQWSDTGLRFPFAYDPVRNKPSVTLLFPYITFVLAVLSTIALHFKASLAIASWTSIGFWIIATVLYMMRHLTRAKFDLDDKSIELDNDAKEDEDGSKSPSGPISES